MLQVNSLRMMHLGFKGFCISDDFPGMGYFVSRTMRDNHKFACLDCRLISQHTVLGDSYAVKAGA